MCHAARTLSLSLALTVLLGACQSAPNPAGTPFRAQRQSLPAVASAAAPAGDVEADRKRQVPRKAQPRKPAQPVPAKPRPKPQPSKPAPVSERPLPKAPGKSPSRPTPYPTVSPKPYRGQPPYQDPDAWERERWERERRQDAVRITRVWTDGVGTDHLTIHWTTDRPTVGLVEWGETDFVDRTEWQTAADTYHSVVIRDLTPDTEYRFRVMARAVGGSGVWSPELRVRTET